MNEQVLENKENEDDDKANESTEDKENVVDFVDDDFL